MHDSSNCDSAVRSKQEVVYLKGECYISKYSIVNYHFKFSAFSLCVEDI